MAPSLREGRRLRRRGGLYFKPLGSDAIFFRCARTTTGPFGQALFVEAHSSEQKIRYERKNRQIRRQKRAPIRSAPTHRVFSI